jgi:hypothetical protein
MSFASKQSGYVASTEVGTDIISALEQNFPVPALTTPLVSGTTYIIAGQPVPNGIYGVEATFTLVGDNTTSFSSVLIMISTEVPAGEISANSVLINTTLPDTDTYSFTYNAFVNIGNSPTDPPAPDFSPIYATILPTFTGTAPTSPSHYLRLYKLV